MGIDGVNGSAVFQQSHDDVGLTGQGSQVQGRIPCPQLPELRMDRAEWWKRIRQSRALIAVGLVSEE